MLQVLLQSDLDNVSGWCDAFRLTINSDKTHVLWCQSENDNCDLSVHTLLLKGKVLRAVVKFNYLGVLIDSHLTFGPHVTKGHSIW